MVRVPVKLCVFVLFSVGATHAAETIDSVYARIDAAAKTFKGVSADISNTEHNGLLNSDDTKPGTAKFLRVKPGLTKVLIDYKTEALSYDGNEGKMYKPKTNTVDVFKVGDKQNMVNQYLALGFGVSSAELKASYDVTYVGEEQVAGQSASHVKLIPKSPDTRQKIKQADLWYGPSGSVLQQKITTPSGDYNLLAYSNMKFGAMPDKDLELKLPKGVVVQKH